MKNVNTKSPFDRLPEPYRTWTIADRNSSELEGILRNDNCFFPVTTIVSFQWFQVVIVGCCSSMWT